MPATISKTIGSGGDYATIALFEAALPADLTASDEIWEATFLDPTGSGGATITGTVCDATRFISFKGSRAHAYAGMWGAYRAGGRNGISTVSGAAAVVYFRDCCFYGSGSHCLSVSGTNAVVYCIRVSMFGQASASTGNNFAVTAAGATLNCDWCLSIDASNEGTAAGFHCINGTLTARNCTHVGAGIGFKRTAGTMAATNCYSASSNLADYSGTMTLTTCHSNDTTAASVGGAGNTQIALANAGFRARRHPSLVAYTYGYNHNDGKNVPVKHGRDFPGMLVGSRFSATASQTSVGVAGGDAVDNADGTYTGTTGYKRWNGTASTIKLPLGTGNRTIVARLRISSGPATNAIRGLYWVWDESTANDTFSLRTDASGYFVCEVTDADGGSTTATSTTKIGDLANGDHDIRGVLDGNTLTIYVNGVATGTGDATGKVTFTSPIAATNVLRGYYTTGGNHYYLGANAALLEGTGVFAAAVTTTGALPQHSDNAGWCHDLRLTEASAATMKTGGTAWASPGLDILGRDIVGTFPIGCCTWEDADGNTPGYAESTGAGGRSGNAVMVLHG